MAWLLAGILAPSAAVLAGLWLQPWVGIVDLVQDGVFSGLRSVLWIGTASVCAFAAAMVGSARADRARLSFAMAALVTLWLGVNDAFPLGDMLTAFAHIPQIVTYGLIAAAYIASSLRFILSGRLSLFIVALLLLGASLDADALGGDETGLRVFGEEALKVLGAAFWAGFHVLAAMTAIEDLATGRITTVDLSAPRLGRVPPQRRMQS